MSHFIDLLSAYGLFFGIPLLFLAIVLWVYRPSAFGGYRDDGRLPFTSEEGAESTHR